MFGSKRREQRKAAMRFLDLHDQIHVRIYSHGHMLMGPVSLSDLATIIKYGGYESDVEHSIVYIPSGTAPIDAPFDVTIERKANL